MLVTVVRDGFGDELEMLVTAHLYNRYRPRDFVNNIMSRNFPYRFCDIREKFCDIRKRKKL